jgi:lysophospholipase
METDDKRAVFLEEFDSMAAYVSPVEDLSPAAASEPVVEAGFPPSTEPEPSAA